MQTHDAPPARPVAPLGPSRPRRDPRNLPIGFAGLLAALILVMIGLLLWRSGVLGAPKSGTTAPRTGAVPFGSPTQSASQPIKVSPSVSPPATSPPPERKPSFKRRLSLVATIHGDITPKSVSASGDGLVFAQNMMYRHTITVYNRRYRLVKTIRDTVNLADLGYPRYEGTYQGAPVEAAFSPDGDHAYVSNYSMYGPGFGPEGTDSCTPASGYDDSFVYRVDTSRLAIDQAIRVGAVPKFVAVTPNDRLVLVSNWCSFDLSVISVRKGKTVRTLYLGAHPRGIAVTSDSSVAYVAIMGTTSIAEVHLDDFHVSWIYGVGSGPRHLVIDPSNRFLYVTLNSAGMVAKIDLRSDRVVERISTGQAPRSMAIAEDGRSLYVVNYESNTVAKVRTRDMKVIQTIPTGFHPIGITFDPGNSRVWVACYSGEIMVFRDA
jgi:YVTN family beta-propeller protein